MTFLPYDKVVAGSKWQHTARFKSVVTVTAVEGVRVMYVNAKGIKKETEMCYFMQSFRLVKE